MDRCITLTMHRKKSAEVCLRVRDLDGTDLRRKCSRFVRDHPAAIAAARPEPSPGLNDRAADIWEPLIVLADVAGGDWPAIARHAAVKLSAGVPDTTIIGSLLLDIFIYFGRDNDDRVFSRDIVGYLNANNNRPWAEARKSRTIDELRLAHQLRPYGIRPRYVWIQGATGRGYIKSDFDDLWSRYISRSDLALLKADSALAMPPDQGVQNPEVQ
jgi:hypothetical protein